MTKPTSVALKLRAHMDDKIFFQIEKRISATTQSRVWGGISEVGRQVGNAQQHTLWTCILEANK